MIKNLGRFGEELVAKLTNMKRVRGSGARWPWKQDLWSDNTKRLGQVKTSRSKAFVRSWNSLRNRAKAERAYPVWYNVYVVDGDCTAYVFEIRHIHTIQLGPGGDL